MPSMLYVVGIDNAHLYRHTVDCVRIHVVACVLPGICVRVACVYEGVCVCVCVRRDNVGREMNIVVLDAVFSV